MLDSNASLVRKPNGERSNLELVSSLQSNFANAQEDYAPEHSPTTNGNGHSNGSKPSLATWTSRDGDDLYIPRIEWSASGVEEDPSRYEITVKLFYLSDVSIEQRAKQTKDAVRMVLKELAVDKIDLLIISFPGLAFEGDCEWEADRKASAQGNDQIELASWPAVESLIKAGTVKRLGVAEFGSDKLSRFINSVETRPEVNQINVKDCCNVPPPLATFAKKNHIELLTHNDCTNVLPSGTLRELLGQKGAGVLGAKGGLEGDLQPSWVIKYTAVVKERGVIENKGYFAAASLVQSS